MHVAVIGAGGTGGLYGGVLARAGHEVRLLARGPHLAAIRQRGLEVRSADFGTFQLQLPASDDPADLGQADLVLFAVKTYDLAPAAEAARQALAPDGVALTFQNGLEAPDQLAQVVGAARVLIGTTRVETTVLEPGVIGHLTANHWLSVSELQGPPTPRVEQLAQTLRAADLNANVVEDGHLALWEKAWLLIPMATLTSLCRAPIGPIRELPETRALLETVVDEVSAVAAASGYTAPEPAQHARQTIYGVPGTWNTSMARDFARGGRTELEAITGALVRLAEARQVPVPASRFAYGVLKLRSQLEAGTPTTPEAVAGKR